MKKLLILPLMALVFLYSCVEDEGNYKYTELNQVQVDSIHEDYQVLAYYDTLKITPEISGSIDGDDLSNYEYQWYICSNTAHNHIELSKEKDLNWPADIYPGNHTLYFVIKDKVTGLETINKTTVHASSPFTRGFLLLGNRPGSDELGLDMISMIPERDTAYIENVFDNSKMQLKNPKSIEHLSVSRLSMWLMSAGDETFQISISDTVEVFGEMNDLGYIMTSVPHKNPMVVTNVSPVSSPSLFQSAAHVTFVTEDMAFSRRISADLITFTEPFNRYAHGSDNLFHPYPYVFCRMNNNGTPVSMSWPAILYDLDSDCFVYASAYDVTSSVPTLCRSFQDLPYNDMKFNNKPLGRTIIYGENDYSQSNGFSNALMGDKYGDFYIYRFRQSNASSASSTARGVAPTMTTYCYPVDKSIATNIENATHYYFATDASALLYTVGNTLYEYDYVNKRCASKEFDAEITYLAAEYCSVPNDYSQYFVATYNGAKGMIYKMKVTNNPNAVEIIQLDDVRWEVDMKVTSIVWKAS